MKVSRKLVCARMVLTASNVGSGLSGGGGGKGGSGGGGGGGGRGGTTHRRRRTPRSACSSCRRRAEWPSWQPVPSAKGAREL